MILKSFSACECSSSGSTSTSCTSSGVCSCKSNVVGTKCSACNSGYYGFPNCQGRNLNTLKIKFLRIIKTFSACSSGCSSSTSCSSSGECSCKSNVVGTKCTACESGYSGFPNCQGEN